MYNICSLEEVEEKWSPMIAPMPKNISMPIKSMTRINITVVTVSFLFHHDKHIGCDQV